MELTVDTQPIARIEADALVTYAFDQEKPTEGILAQLDAATGGALGKLAASGELTGKMLETTLLYYPAGLAAQRLLVLGAGKKGKFGTAELRRIAGAAVRTLKSRQVKTIAFLAREDDRSTAAAQAIVEGMLLANFDSDKYKTDKKPGNEITAAALAGWEESARADADLGLARGRIIGESQNFARELGNEPSNKLTPRLLADRAAAMAREAGLSVEVFDENKIAELKMGALLSVAQGSAEPPRMIIMTYIPATVKEGAPVLGLVGKAITFDTGGISIKPANDMEKMKYDMCGGAAMIGAMRAIAALKPQCKVIAVIPSSENMPGGRAQKPGDVQFSMAGKSIEVINTDAEGRLVLADGIAYAKQLGCTHLIDAATLTGAVVVALSNVNVGVFGSDQSFTDQLLASAKVAGEKMWPLPIDDDYREMIKSGIADIQNVGSGKGGGAITAAMFLKEFTGDTPWIHLDIAGTAWQDDVKPWNAKGATGVAVRTLVDLAMKFGGNGSTSK
ncbi:MAG TPA: leucyl aminopeptidase [Candidatus Saccharimonadales bacterium]|jgi:leucyl aminopeptidase|nr:leucyl aminopeptidase [Candidatus Saccharimonadales bacterium]